MSVKIMSDRIYNLSVLVSNSVSAYKTLDFHLYLNCTILATEEIIVINDMAYLRIR